MNTAQKIICTIGALIALFMFTSIETGNYYDVVTVKYQDNLIEYKCKDRKECDNLILKSENNVLFFDGQYFYDEAPNNKEGSRVNLVKRETVNIGGDMSRGEFCGLFIMLLICVAVACGMASPNTGDYYDY